MEGVPIETIQHPEDLIPESRSEIEHEQVAEESSSEDYSEDSQFIVYKDYSVAVNQVDEELELLLPTEDKPPS